VSTGTMINNNNYRVFFRYFFYGVTNNFFFLNHSTHGTYNISLLIPRSVLYYLALYFKFSSLTYSSQLSDIFAYELPITSKTLNKSKTLNLCTSSSIVTYNFHSLLNQERFFIFTSNSTTTNIDKSLTSVTELFPNAWWLEREIAELHGIFFRGKKDLRNLMLQYGDVSSPFQKSFPSIGVRELAYDPVVDLITQQPLTVNI